MKIPVLLFVCLLLLSACATGPDRKAPETRPDAAAREYLEQEDYSAAALEYRRLADSMPDRSTNYRLLAVDAHLRANDLTAAADLLDRIELPADDQRYRLQHRLLSARLALYNDRPEQARALLPASLPENIAGTLLADYHDLRARLFERRDEWAAAVRERFQLQQYLGSEQARANNSRRLWEDLGQLDQNGLQSLASGPESPTLAGWVELALIYQRLLSQPEQLRQAVDAWRSRFADHPAVPGITSEILATSRRLQFRPQKIALLLPFTGSYKRAAEAIRDGFLAAWYAAEDYKPVVRIYDTDALSIRDDYRHAVEQGAGIIIGPLEKSAIRTLIDTGGISTTTLALNQTEGGGDEAGVSGGGRETAQLYQLALSPEHEVRQIAQRGLFEGFNRSLVITPDNPWGGRLADTFTDEWHSLGGTLLESVRYDPNAQDFISPVKRLLNIDSSEARIARLRQKLSRNIKADSRRRRDADFIYMAAIPVNARQIVPQFRFFRVNQTPVYSTSHVYAGFPDPQLDSDMNGVEFTDIPWVLRPDGKQSPLQKHIETQWSSQNAGYRRLYAFGVDAFRIIPHLGRMSLLDRYNYEGETGELTMRDNGHINRRLQWARFVNGRPVPLQIGHHAEQGTEPPEQR